MTIRKWIALSIIVILTSRCQSGATPIAIPLPVREVKQECATVQSELPTKFLTEGTVLLGDFSQQGAIGHVEVLTPDATEPIHWSNVPIYGGGATSPDGKLFAYQTTSEEIASNYSKLIVIDTTGKVTFSLPWDNKWGSLYWLNNRQLEFPYFWDDYWQNVPPISDIINVLTGQHESVSPELPDAWTPGGPLIPFLVVWKTAYDPTFSVVSYMRGNEPEQSFVLWDLKNNHELCELNKWSTRTVRPAWTSDGKRLAVVVLNQKEDNWDRLEIYLVDRSGDAERWIDIRGYFKDATVSVNWSPNGRYLAIVPNGQQPLLMLDTLTGELLDYCIPAYVGYGSVIWSADSSQIILPRLSDSNYPSIVLNIKNKQAAYITNNPNLIPIGWLANSP